MSLMSMMREFSHFRQEKEIEEMEEAVKDADSSYLRETLKKYVYDDEIVEKLLPAMQLLQEHGHEDNLLDLLSFKEQEISKLVEHKDKFEQKTSQSDEELDTESQEDESDKDYVLEYVTNKYQ